MQTTIISGAKKMSQKSSKPRSKSSFSKIYRWIFIIITVVILEVGGIITATKLCESENVEYNEQISAIVGQLSSHGSRLNILEELPNIVADNSKQISSISNVISLLGDNLNIIKQDLANNKIENIDNELIKLNHKMETVEETKNQEALILSIALLIKENALYNRKFAQEVDILAELSANQNDITNDVNTLKELKNTIIVNGYTLAEQYKLFSDKLVFENNIKNENNEQKNTTVSKSIKLIKDTVAGINFDKVIVIKKDNRTDEQKILISTLNDFVNNHNYTEAIDFIENNTEFSKIENKDFINWIETAKKTISFDRAISNIISKELSAIRKDIVEINQNQGLQDD